MGINEEFDGSKLRVWWELMNSDGTEWRINK